MMRINAFETLTSPRLRLRPLWPEDVHPMLAHVGDYEIARWTQGIPHPYSLAAAEKFIAHASVLFERGERYYFAILEADGGNLIGGADLTPHKSSTRKAVPEKRVEIGYWIARSAQNKGYAAEAGGRLLRFAAEELGADRVHATVAMDNDASIRVLEKLGMRLKGRGEEHWPARDTLVAVARYAIARTDILRK